MPAFHKPIVILGASLSWVLTAFGCGSSSSGGDDDDPGSVLGGGAGGATGGSGASGGKGGGTSGGKGGSGTGGGGNCKAVGESYEVVDSMSAGSCCEGLTTSCDLTTTTDPETGIMRSNGTCTCDDGSTGGTGTGGAGGTGGNTSGTGGSAAGAGGTAGTGGTGGAGGSAGTPGSGSLGSGCASDANCASGLVCVTATGMTLDVGSPGGGLCTLACTADTECTAIAPGSWCVAFDEAQTITYCLEGCETGAAGEPKCNGRADFACGLLGLIPGSTACTTSDDCVSTELCSTTSDPPVCGEIVTGCLPNCGGDFHCPSGDFCDFSTGLCVPDAPSGQPIGTACDPNATTNACNGFCIAATDTGTEGVCTAFCTFAPGLLGCGWDGSTTTPPDAACLFLTRLSPDLGVGDVGLCGSLCDCNDDCAASTDRCVDESGGEIMTLWGRAGYCRALQTGETEADTFACQ